MFLPAIAPKRCSQPNDVQPMGLLGRLPNELLDDILVRVARDEGGYLRNYYRACRATYSHAFELAVRISSQPIARVRASNPILSGSHENVSPLPAFDEHTVAKAQAFIQKVTVPASIHLLGRLERMAHPDNAEREFLLSIRKSKKASTIREEFFDFLYQRGHRQARIFMYAAEGVFEGGLTAKQQQQLLDLALKHREHLFYAKERAWALWRDQPLDARATRNVLLVLEALRVDGKEAAHEQCDLKYTLARCLAISSRRSAGADDDLAKILPELITVMLENDDLDGAEALCARVHPSQVGGAAALEAVADRWLAEHRPGRAAMTLSRHGYERREQAQYLLKKTIALAPQCQNDEALAWSSAIVQWADHRFEPLTNWLGRRCERLYFYSNTAEFPHFNNTNAAAMLWSLGKRGEALMFVAIKGQNLRALEVDANWARVAQPYLTKYPCHHADEGGAHALVYWAEYHRSRSRPDDTRAVLQSVRKLYGRISNLEVKAQIEEAMELTGHSLSPNPWNLVQRWGASLRHRKT
jgi:hypothetical protein